MLPGKQEPQANQRWDDPHLAHRQLPEECQLPEEFRAVYRASLQAKENLARLPSTDVAATASDRSYEPDLEKLEVQLSYHFTDRERLLLAVSAGSQDETKQGRPLRSLGSAAIELFVRERLYHSFPSDSEGALARRRCVLLSEDLLAALADGEGLSRFIRVGPFDNRDELVELTSVRATLVRKIFGAIVHDGGLDGARSFAEKVLTPRVKESQFDLNPEADMCALLRSLGYSKIRFKFVNVRGLDHQKEYQCQVFANDTSLGASWGSSKIDARKQVTLALLQQLARQEIPFREEGKGTEPPIRSPQ